MSVSGNKAKQNKHSVWLLKSPAAERESAKPTFRFLLYDYIFFSALLPRSPNQASVRLDLLYIGRNVIIIHILPYFIVKPYQNSVKVNLSKFSILYFVNSFATLFLKFHAVIFSNSSSNNSLDVLKPKMPLGYVFIQFSINSISLSCFSSKSSPFGMWRRISLFWFSFVPLSHELYG